MRSKRPEDPLTRVRMCAAHGVPFFLYNKFKTREKVFFAYVSLIAIAIL